MCVPPAPWPPFCLRTQPVGGAPHSSFLLPPSPRSPESASSSPYLVLMVTARCNYDILGVPRSATEAEIRSAYRRIALVTHPDKNPGDAGADARFQEVQNAYSVLSDPHERAWYDDHWEEILRGDDVLDGDGDDGDDDGRGASANARARNVRLAAGRVSLWVDGGATWCGGGGRAHPRAHASVGVRTLCSGAVSDESLFFRAPPRWLVGCVWLAHVLPPLFLTRCTPPSALPCTPTPQRRSSALDLYRYFSSSAYTPATFHTVFATVFDTLASEERAAPSPPPESLLPPFGIRSSGYGVTRAFYAAWSHFASAKTFAHADAYNPATAPNRDIRRAMEKENRLRRSDARSTFNALVRSLVAYVRRRDARVGEAERAADAAAAAVAAARAAERADAVARRKAASKAAAAAMAAEEMEAGLAELVEATRREEAAEAAEAMGGGVGDVDAEAGGGGGDREWLCEACTKRFRSESQWRNHERSKKHRAMVDKWKRQALAEERAFQRLNLDGDGAGGGASGASEGDDGPSDGGGGGARTGGSGDARGNEDSDASWVLGGTRNGRGDGGANGAASAAAADDGAADDDGDGGAASEDEVLRSMARGRAKRARKAEAKRRSAAASAALGALLQPASSTEEEGAAGTSDGVTGDASGAAQECGKDAASSHSDCGDHGSDDINDDDGADVAAAETAGGCAPATALPATPAEWPPSVPPPAPRRPKKGKRGKQNPPPPLPAAPAAAAAATAWTCNVCGVTFKTRNRLFTHVKERGHALAAPPPPPPAVEGGKGGRRRRRAN